MEDNWVVEEGFAAGLEFGVEIVRLTFKSIQGSPINEADAKEASKFTLKLGGVPLLHNVDMSRTAIVIGLTGHFIYYPNKISGICGHVTDHDSPDSIVGNTQLSRSNSYQGVWYGSCIVSKE